MADRPAVELLYEWDVACVALASRSLFASHWMPSVLKRLARAEQALADNEQTRAEITARAQSMLATWPKRMADAWDEGYNASTEWRLDENRQWVAEQNPYRAALRASHECGYDYDPFCSGCRTAYGDAGLTQGGQWVAEK